MPGMAGVFLDPVRVHPPEGQRPTAVMQHQVIEAVPGGGAPGLGARGVEIAGDRGDGVAHRQPETVVHLLRDAELLAAVAKQRSPEPDPLGPVGSRTRPPVLTLASMRSARIR